MDKIYFGLFAGCLHSRRIPLKMQKDIFKEDYFGTLMCILIDESRKLLPQFNPSKEAHKIQNDMCKVGSWIEQVPIGVIIQTVPQDYIQKLQQDVLPEYRRLAAKLIDHFIDTFELQGGDRNIIKEKFEKMYIWKQ